MKLFGRTKEQGPITTASSQNQTRWDIQDDPDYWNEESRIVEDTCKASLPEVLANPMAGYQPHEIKPDPNVFRILQAHEAMSDHSPVLEMGCGGGRMGLIWLSTCEQMEFRPPMFMTDHAPTSVAIAQARFRGIRPDPNDRFECVAGGDLATKFDAESVGVVYTHTALQHNSKWKQDYILRALWGVLKPRGYLYLWCEATFTSERRPEVVLWHSYSDDRGSAGTAAWWIAHICWVGFELIEYADETYLFRKL